VEKVLRYDVNIVVEVGPCGAAVVIEVAAGADETEITADIVEVVVL